MQDWMGEGVEVRGICGTGGEGVWCVGGSLAPFAGADWVEKGVGDAHFRAMII